MRLMMTEEKILDLFLQGFDCGQVVFSHFAESFGLDEITAKKISACFGGGMFRGETCGAVTGALMVLGLNYGHYLPNDSEQKSINVAKIAEFNAAFAELYPSAICKEILQYDISDPEDMKIIMDKELLTTLCPKLVCDVICLLEKIMDNREGD